MYVDNQAHGQSSGEALREKCGVVAVYSPDGMAVPDAYTGLEQLQHRGQDGSGFAFERRFGNHARIDTVKDLGLIAAGYQDTVHPFEITGPEFATGHARYGTAPTENPQDALHPVRYTQYNGSTVDISHNGHLMMRPLRKLARSYSIDPVGTDTEIVTKIIGNVTEDTGSIEPALQEVLPQLQGAFNFAILSDEGLYVATDRHHLRPFVIGRKGNSIMVASEVGALSAAGYAYVQETKAGTFAKISEDGIEVTRWAKEDRKDCIFEHVYLSKSPNIINGANVGAYRMRVGQAMARQEADDFQADIVVPILGTAKHYAVGYSQESGVQYQEVLKKNPKILRTFIEGDQNIRAQSVDDKFTIPHPELIKGKKIVVVDDSLVRGTTIRRIVKKLQAAEPDEIHIRIASDKVVDVCEYGVNIKDKAELFVYDGEEIEGISSLTFVPLKEMAKATGKPLDNFCTGCFGGSYPKTKATKPRQRIALV